MEAEVTPEPQDAEREAILAVLAQGVGDTSGANESPWRRAGLDEAMEAWDEPVTGRSKVVARAPCAVVAVTIQPVRTMSPSAPSA